MKRAASLCVLLACGGPHPTKPEVPLRGTPVVETPGAPPRSSPPASEKVVTPDTPTGAAAKRDAELALSVAPYLDAFLNTEAVFTRDGKRVVLVSNRDGLPQLYVAAPDGPATRVVTTNQRITDIFAAGGGKDVVFRSDTGADENWSIFRVGLDGTGLVQLTPGDKLMRGHPFIPDGRPSVMFFNGRKAADVGATVYSTSSTVAATPKAIFTSDKPGGLIGVSPDGKHGVYFVGASHGENQLLHIDLETGKAAPFYPPAGEKVSVMEVNVARDNRRAYVSTDGGSDQCLVLAIDMITGKQVGKHAFTPGTARVSGMSVSRDTSLLAVVIAVGDRSELHLLDARNLAERATVPMPRGSAPLPSHCAKCSTLAFSDDGKRLVLPWSAPERPTDLYIVDTATGKLTPRNEARPSLPALQLETLSADIPAFDGQKIQAHVYLPKGGRTTKHPVIVSFHGGPANTAMIRWTGPGAWITSLGYVLVEPNVRGSVGFGRAFEAADDGPKRLDAFKDIETASRWAAAQPWADKDKMVIVGGSYGGYSTLIAMTRFPDLWRAGVDQFGIANLPTFLTTTQGTAREVSKTEFGDPDKDAAFLTSISPITDIDKIAAPLFVYAGANDPRVPRTESDQVVRALRGRKVPVEYMVADNEGHSAARRETLIQLYPRMMRFIEAALTAR